MLSKLSIPVVGQVALGIVAMALLAALGFAHVVGPDIAAGGIVAVFLALTPGIASGHAIDATTLASELAPVFTHAALGKTSSVTVDRTVTVTRTVPPPADITATVDSPNSSEVAKS